MGGYLSKWRQKPSTVEVLDKLVKDIDALETCRQTNLDKQKQIITSLVLYSVAVYILFFAVFYFCYWPDEWLYRLLYSLPLLLFPLIVWAVKQFLHWYFVKRIKQNEEALEELKERKKTILDQVMETETYKKAKEIIEKFAPELKADTILSDTAIITATPSSGELRQRNVGQAAKGAGAALSSSGASLDPVTPRPSQSVGVPPTPLPPGMLSATRSEKLMPLRPMPMPNRQFVPGTPMPAVPPGAVHPPPGPPMARPVLPRERTLMDRLVEYLLGDGPQNRFALICCECQSHNGMAMKEEFEYIGFRCCYCYTVNQARKQKPKAPRLESEHLLLPRQSSVSSTPVVEGESASVYEAGCKVDRSERKVVLRSAKEENSDPVEPMET